MSPNIDYLTFLAYGRSNTSDSLSLGRRGGASLQCVLPGNEGGTSLQSVIGELSFLFCFFLLEDIEVKMEMGDGWVGVLCSLSCDSRSQGTLELRLPVG